MDRLVMNFVGTLSAIVIVGFLLATVFDRSAAAQSPAPTLNGIPAVRLLNAEGALTIRLAPGTKFRCVDWHTQFRASDACAAWIIE